MLQQNAHHIIGWRITAIGSKGFFKLLLRGIKLIFSDVLRGK
ncbi:hypothetical protein [Psychrobacter sp. JCM 18901]|nr:hypothetical protein [Psychrobacter sp. JCM 18901]